MSEGAEAIESADGEPVARRRLAVGLQSSAAVTAGLAVVSPLQEVYSISWDIGAAVQTFRVTGWGATQHFPGQADVAVPTTRIAITFLVGAVLLAAGVLARSVPRGRPVAPLLVLAGAAVTAAAALTVFLDYRAAVAQTASTPPEVVTAVTVHAGGWLVGVAGATAVATALLACWTARPVPAPAPTAPAPAPAAPAPAPAAAEVAADPAPPDQESPRTLPAWSPADFQRPRPGAEAG
jgi:hypothetical protein